MTPRSSTPDSAAERWERYRGESFLIVGFTERTGRSVARLFEEQGVPYKVSDLRPREELAGALEGLTIDASHVFAGPQTPEQLSGITTVILSPGVPRSIPLVQAAKGRGIPVLGDVDFTYDLIKDTRIVAITGTDGKTTTTLLAGAILAKGATVVVAGNVGQPVCSRYREILESDFVVLELSSFMLEEIQSFRPSIAAITNVAEDHVDRYEGFGEYLQAKLNILRHCGPEDVFIHNLDDPVLGAWHPEHVGVRTISRRRTGSDYFFADGKFHFGGEKLGYDECRLRGSHNIENILAALAIGCEAGIAPGDAAAAVREFEPVPNRFEYLGQHGGVDVYNDSKATTVHAIDRALESLVGSVVLIVGGRGKGLDFSPLKRHEAKIKLLMCYGEAGEEVRRRLAFPRSDYAYPFAEAVALAAKSCEPGDTLLLSPGCTSFDQHVDYVERGAEFRELSRSWLRGS
jgi:UDP-N-acetylmuramoylalanine--D-glutamate ligase